MPNKNNQLIPDNQSAKQILEAGSQRDNGYRSSTPNTSAIKHLIWAVTLTILVLGAAAFVLLNKSATASVDASKQIYLDLKQAFKPTVNVINIISTNIGEFNNTGKLVVHTHKVDVEISRQTEKRIFNDWLPAGTAAIKIKARENSVQFYIPTKELTISCFSFNSNNNTLEVRVPPVKLDREQVSVQSDPNKIEIEKNGSWVPFIGPQIKPLEAAARQELKNVVIKTANNRLIRDRAQLEAEGILRRLFNVIKESLREGVKIKFMFS